MFMTRRQVPSVLKSIFIFRTLTPTHRYNQYVCQFSWIFAPMAISHIIENHQDTVHWQLVFYIAAGVYTIGNLFYCLMASGEEQPWNKN